MKITSLSCLMIMLACFNTVQGQHHETEKQSETQRPLTFAPVRSDQLNDPELKDFKMESTVMTVAPGGIDTVSHRHDCELFGYVLEGAVEIALVDKNTMTYKAGQMFYEKRNILHTVTRNSSKDKPAKVLLMFLIKNGRPGYTPEYPTKSGN
jgi:quercetin dioxygenase-like cupin family protein